MGLLVFTVCFSALQHIGHVGFFPGEVRIGSAEVTVGSGFAVERCAQTELRDDRFGAQVKHLANGTSEITLDGKLLKIGSRGEAVKWLQRELTLRGFACGNIDGIFDAKTKSALIKFQKAAKISADGICGPITASKLKG